MSCLKSFHGTPILFLTEHVRAGLPVAAQASVPAILRDVWLGLTWRDGWFVGPYWILPDRVSLFACAGSAACASGVWATRWKRSAADRISHLSGGRRVEWAGSLPPLPMASEPDYHAALDALAAEAVLVSGGSAGTCANGILWQLL